MYDKKSPESIQSMFNSLAGRYDLTNAVLSFYLHKRWNNQLIVHSIERKSSHTYLDLCAGTGEIAFNYLKKCAHPCSAYLVDFSESMLAHAKTKSCHASLSEHQIHYVEADVQKLPFANHFADRATMAYGIRNVANPQAAIKEIHRVLKPEGSFGILELTRPTNKIVKFFHQIYLERGLPLLGKFLTSNKEAYNYLCNSIHHFVPAQEIKKIMEEGGFVETKIVTLSGGIASMVLGKKRNE